MRSCPAYRMMPASLLESLSPWIKHLFASEGQCKHSSLNEKNVSRQNPGYNSDHWNMHTHNVQLDGRVLKRDDRKRRYVNK